jgi:hypothetical protein
MRKWQVVMVVTSIACLSPASSWANYACSGTLDWVTVSPSGVVTVSSQSSGLGTFYPCQIGTTVYGVGPDACKAMLSELLVAHATGALVSWSFSDSLACANSQSTRGNGNWYWLGASPSSWYYGPQVQ